MRPDGYRVITIFGNEKTRPQYRSGRLAFLYMTGHWPEWDVDHKNRKRGDDRWKNLREATRSQNLRNRQMGKCPYCGRGYATRAPAS